MNAKKLIIFFFLIITVSLIYSEEFGFDYNGEVRTRLSYENNYDMELESDDGSLILDFRAQMDFTMTSSMPLYFFYKFQLGNISTDEDLFDTDNFLENIRLKSRNLLFGWEDKFFEVQAGLINTDSPSDVVIDDENTGISLKADLDTFQLKSFYSMTNLVDGYFNFIESGEGLNSLFFVGADSDEYFNLDLDLWTMYLNGNDADDFSYNSIWTGLELENKNDYFEIDSKFIYNSGWADLTNYDLDIPISAFYTSTKISIEPVKDGVVFTRFNLTGGADSDSGSINQFQVIDGEGSLDTGLGLLFGGSPYSSESYFSSKSVSIVEDNLSSGDLVLDDPGLFIYELGFSEDFDFLPFSSELIIGGANTCDLFSGGGFLDSLIGLEADLHNKMKLSNDLDFFLSMSLLYPGNAFEELFTVNNSDSEIGTDPSFKLDCKLVYSY